MPGVELTTVGWLASAIIGKLVDRGHSYLGDNYDLYTGTGKMIENLKNQLPHIQIVIEAAEKQQITNKGLDKWLEQLKDAAYEAEDVLDDFEAKRICESIKGKGKVSEIASSSVKMVKTLIFSDNDLKKLEYVVDKLEKLCMGDFVRTLQFILGDKSKKHLDHPGSEISPNLAPGEAIFGRDREIELILDMIFNVQYGDPKLQHGDGDGEGSSSSGKSKLSEAVRKGDAQKLHSIGNQKPAVIPIIGVGGVGKTAVAKRIYNNERVEEVFSLRAWVYVSENYDAKKIMGKILGSFGCGIIDTNLMNLETVEKMLKDTIKNHRFLLTLDDLSEGREHTWRRLQKVLCFGEVGSVVVVTTQSVSIANTIRTLPEVTLDVLQPEPFWELFQYYAFDCFKLGDLKDQPPSRRLKQEQLKLIGKQIAKKLHGLPLAGEVIGTLLSTKSLLSTKLETEFWREILASDWWNIKDARKDILPSIVVGYNYLDPELKQCFVFCSIFPKLYVFERERLVQMWIAHGYIQPSELEKDKFDNGDIRLEDIGRKWFGKLVDRSFFQPTLSDGKYLMHDLVRDLAIAVSSNEFYLVISHNKCLPSLARHLGIDCDNLQVDWNWENSTRLRTMILFGNWTNCSTKSISNVFTKYNSLRVLDLSYIGLENNAPNEAICQLSHLRFVDLSFTGIKSIPDEFCALCHLEVLDVRGCKFEKLPKGMKKLINLRHLYASSDTISLISRIGKLTRLQELKEFRIGESKGHRINELMDMNEISGHLVLSNLNNVSSIQEATNSQLDKKRYLKSLELRFEYNNSGPTTEVKMEVLDALKPPCSLEILKIGHGRLASFPGWVFSPHPGLYNLKVIHVYCCWLSNLPSFGELPSLELLIFDYLPLIKKVGSEFYGSSYVVFPSLKELTFSGMTSWRDWSVAEAGKTIFPHLKKLVLSNCPLLLNIETILKGMPSQLAQLSITRIYDSLTIHCTLLKSLEVMELTDIGKLCFDGGLKSLVKLRKLIIIGNTHYVEIMDNNLKFDEQCMHSLTCLHLCWIYSPINGLSIVGRLPSLRTLLIENFIREEYMTTEEISWFNQLTSLEKLEFRNCKLLRCLPYQMELLTSLKKLRINNCPKMISLPVNSLPQNLAELCIDQCPDLIHRYHPNKGYYWEDISYIPFVYFDGKMVTIQA